MTGNDVKNSLYFILEYVLRHVNLNFPIDKMECNFTDNKTQTQFEVGGKGERPQVVCDRTA